MPPKPEGTSPIILSQALASCCFCRVCKAWPRIQGYIQGFAVVCFRKVPGGSKERPCLLSTDPALSMSSTNSPFVLNLHLYCSWFFHQPILLNSHSISSARAFQHVNLNAPAEESEHMQKVRNEALSASRATVALVLVDGGCRKRPLKVVIPVAVQIKEGVKEAALASTGGAHARSGQGLEWGQKQAPDLVLHLCFTTTAPSEPLGDAKAAHGAHYDSV